MSHGAPCCGPSRSGTGEATVVATGPAATSTDGMVAAHGGTFWMGSEDRFAYPEDGEAPLKEIEVGDFWIDALS